MTNTRTFEAMLTDYKRAGKDYNIALKVSLQVKSRLRNIRTEIAEHLASSELGVRIGSMVRNLSNYKQGTWRVCAISLNEWREAEHDNPTLRMVEFDCQLVKKNGDVSLKRGAKFHAYDLTRKDNPLKLLEPKGDERHASTQGRQNAAG